MSFIEDIKRSYHQASIAEKVIYIITAIFLVAVLLPSPITGWFSMPASIGSFLYRPWTIVSYGFLHLSFLHIVSNALVLYYIGNLFLDFHTPKQFTTAYILGILFGGFAFLATGYFNIISPSATLVGASAGVTAIFVAIATKVPRYALRLRFIGSVELWVLAMIWVLMSILQFTGVNKGGAISHLGGAVAGFLFTQKLSNTNIINNIIDSLTNFIKGIFVKKKGLKTVHKKTAKKQTRPQQNSYHQKKIDEILDKISKSGYESLSAEEKEFLFNAGKK